MVPVRDEREVIDELLTRMRRAVRRRLMSDVPVGFFLSGGIDSSLTTALAAEVTSSPVKTFTLTYAGRSTTAGKEEDCRWARWVAARYGTEHHEETIDVANYPASIRKILRAFDEPFAGVVSTYFLVPAHRAARQGRGRRRRSRRVVRQLPIASHRRRCGGDAGAEESAGLGLARRSAGHERRGEKCAVLTRMCALP